MMAYFKQLLLSRITLAVIAAIAVGGLTLVLLGMRQYEYVGRVGLLASPAAASDTSDTAPTEFGAVVSLSLPAIAEVAQGPTLLSKVSAAVPGSPSPDILSQHVTVDLVPGSGLARLSVQATTPDSARALTNGIADQVVAANLLGEAGSLRKLDAPTVTELRPDWTLALGMALAAAAAAAVVALGLSTLTRPSDRQRVQRALSAAGVDRPVALIQSDGDSGTVRETVVLCQAAGRPIRLLALEPSLIKRADQLSAELVHAGVAIADGSSENVAVVVLTDRQLDGGELSALLSALPDLSALLAVIVEPGQDQARDRRDDLSPAT